MGDRAGGNLHSAQKKENQVLQLIKYNSPMFYVTDFDITTGGQFPDIYHVIKSNYILYPKCHLY